MLSLVDPLTRLYNVRHFHERIAQHYANAVRHSKPLALLMADLDHFKHVNDTHGHQAGDEVLYQTARIIERAVRRGDTPARVGGEEFAVILPETGVEGARQLAERIRARVSEQTMRLPDGAGVPITISVGLACTANLDVSSHEELYAAADKALYTAKQAGRNRVMCAGPEPPHE